MKENLFENKEYSSVDFSGQKLSHSEYDSCAFKNCNFSNADISDNDFINCRFDACNFALVKISGSGLKDVEFVGCKLVGINFDHCTDFLFAVGFRNCILDYSSFFGKKLKKTRFIDCTMKEVDFSSADLSGAEFNRCDLSMTVFKQSNLENADFRTAFNYAFDPEVNKMKKAKFSSFGLAGLLGKYNIEIE